ncbi:neutral zinc metallopeptidase [Peribacillus butanolivorans]|uniref:neutral zinc metallopeptidase n=1 Tax=Peribacillus butanolivorans TaxID=421767 RepID=UPI0036CD70A7
MHSRRKKINKWQGRQGSSNVECKRGMSGKGVAGIGGGVGLVIVLIVALLGGNPSELLGSLNSTDTLINLKIIYLLKNNYINRNEKTTYLE